MNTQNQATQSTFSSEHDEHILVVKRSSLFPTTADAWQGLKTVNPENILTVIRREKEFHPRSLMETDPRYKQIIPYLIFSFDNTYFLMQRREETREQRLKNSYTLGIGGHMCQEDFMGTDIMDWAEREFKEEIDYRGNYAVETLGIINDDSNPVGEVHLGCALLLKGTSNKISIKSELKSGHLATLDECLAHYPLMEKWSQILLDHLKTLKT